MKRKKYFTATSPMYEALFGEDFDDVHRAETSHEDKHLPLKRARATGLHQSSQTACRSALIVRRQEH
jgi:hypothetical protein